MSVAAHFDLDIDQMDAVTEFLLGYLSEEIYMEHPEGIGDQAIENVCKLNKAIHGLKQASREWNKKLSQALKGMELKQSKLYPCIKDQRFFMWMIYNFFQTTVS